MYACLEWFNTAAATDPMLGAPRDPGGAEVKEERPSRSSQDFRGRGMRAPTAVFLSRPLLFSCGPKFYGRVDIPVTPTYGGV
ncbi:hypothetical protein GCM10028864_02080 [Microlunatus parietis]